MRRREFITLLGGATVSLVTPPLLVAQEARTYRIGFLTGNPREAAAHIAFFDELRMSGFIDGQNLAVIAGGFRHSQRTSFRSGCGACSIRTRCNRQCWAGRHARGTGSDKNDSDTGHIRRPGWKRVGAIAPASRRQYHGCQPACARTGRQAAGHSNGGSTWHSPHRGACRSQRLHASAPGGPERHRAYARYGVFGFFCTHARGDNTSHEPGKCFWSRGNQRACDATIFLQPPIVIARAAALRLPAMYQWPEMAEEGGFAGYGPRITQWYRQLARLLAQVLRGAKPGELPVEQPTRFELVVNLGAAKAISHEIPAGLVLRADKVIE